MLELCFFFVLKAISQIHVQASWDKDDKLGIQSAIAQRVLSKNINKLEDKDREDRQRCVFYTGGQRQTLNRISP